MASREIPMADPNITPVSDASAQKINWPSAKLIAGMNLTPEEMNLYQHHIGNLQSGLAVRNPTSDPNAERMTSTVLQRVVEHNGRFYNIPSVWDGRILQGEMEARKRAAQLGWGYWPSYATPEEADARYQVMHDAMAKDIGYSPYRGWPGAKRLPSRFR